MSDRKSDPMNITGMHKDKIWRLNVIHKRGNVIRCRMKGPCRRIEAEREREREREKERKKRQTESVLCVRERLSLVPRKEV